MLNSIPWIADLVFLMIKNLMKWVLVSRLTTSVFFKLLMDHSNDQPSLSTRTLGEALQVGMSGKKGMQEWQWFQATGYKLLASQILCAGI